jgi:hypothetical protein
MTEVDRRMLFGAAGAALVLAGCKPQGKDKTKAEVASQCDDHGDSCRKADGKKPPNNVEWQPLHYCLVYINLDNNRLIVRTAYYATGFPTALTDRDNPSSKRVDALAQLRAMSANAGSGNWPSAPVASDRDFANFWFGSQQEIYILIDGTLAKLDTEKLVVLSRNKTKQTSTLPSPAPNKTFYNAHAIIDTTSNKQVLYMQNWFLDKNSPHGKKPKRPSPSHTNIPEDNYAMNIHMLLGSVEIPGVVDPDTGNGMGNTP